MARRTDKKTGARQSPAEIYTRIKSLGRTRDRLRCYACGCRGLRSGRFGSRTTVIFGDALALRTNDILLAVSITNGCLCCWLTSVTSKRACPDRLKRPLRWARSYDPNALRIVQSGKIKEDLLGVPALGDARLL
jgi:hypothetical protein